ncbi:MAG: hypothetical protein J7527_10895 [Chitinophagaceae bacterium]|nr:hypothetical protein [Chitinophagaceae bacterium]
MKFSLALLSLAFSALFVTGCSKDIDHHSEYNKSFKAFQEFKQSSGNSYQYMAIQSSWVGSSTQTIITVRNGRVTNRAAVVRGFATGNATTVTIVDEWEENEATLNSHNAGHPSRTLDEIYQLAKNEWLIKRKEATNFFEAKNDGMISDCGYYENNCQDDCTIGIHISWIRKL